MPQRVRFYPKLLTVLREGYSKEALLRDVSAGIVVGVVALPLAIAFAIASGVKPEQGLYTAIVAGFVIAVLGGSRVQVSGPTGAFIVVVYEIVQQYGYAGLAAATFMAGFILIGMGMARMGVVMKFIPYPLTVGFTSGIALIIFSSQLRDFLGLTVSSLPADFIPKMAVLGGALNTINWYALAVGAVSLLIIQLTPRISHRIPGSIIALILATLCVKLLHWPVDTIGSRYGSVPHSLPSPAMVDLHWRQIGSLIRPAITIALLGAVESLLSAVVSDGMIGTRHRTNTELIAQGIGNILSPLFLGIPATGAIARTATNVKNGGRTPVAAMVHAITLLLILLIFGSWAVLIPMPVLAAILIIAAWNMSERRSFLRMFKSTNSDVLVMVVTFLLTVLVDLTTAIEVGLLLSALLFMRRMASVARARYVTKDLIDDPDEDDADAIGKRSIPTGVAVFELYGPLFFGAVDAFRNALQATQDPPKILIFRMRNVVVIDATGLKEVEDLFKRFERHGAKVILSGLRSQPRKVLQRSGLIERIDQRNLCDDIDKALERAEEILKDAGPQPPEAALAAAPSEHA